MDLVLPLGSLGNQRGGGHRAGRGAIPDLRALGRPGQGPRSPGLPAPSFTIQPPTSAACGLAPIPAVGGAKRQRTLPGRSEVRGNSGRTDSLTQSQLAGFRFYQAPD